MVSGNASGDIEENAMDVSNNAQQEQMDAVDEGGNYKTDEVSGTGDEENSTKSCILRMLDEMDRRVEKLRSDALKAEAERDEILTTLDTLNNSQLVHSLEGIDLDEITRYLKRLAQRSAAVHVEISTERSVHQKESLHLVNTLIDNLIMEVKVDVAMARRRCASYLNSCSDSTDAMPDEHSGIDAAFEEAVLGCTIEDQKRVKKRLSGLLSYFFNYTPSLSEIKEEQEEN